MNVSPSKATILKKIRKALTHSTPLPFPQSEGHSTVFKPSQKELEVEFAERLAVLQGRFVFCLDKRELVTRITEVLEHNKWTNILCRDEEMKQVLQANNFTNFGHDHLPSCDVAITSCEALVARTGSILLSSALPSGRTVSVYAPVHFCVAYTSQLVYDVKDGIQLVKEKYGDQLPSLITFATGPSRTADIEKTLVVGVHGPKEVYVFLVDE